MPYRTTQRELKRLIATGAAHDLNKLYGTPDAPDYHDLEKVAYSAGVYGINGALFKHVTTGNLYAIPSRSTAVFYYA